MFLIPARSRPSQSKPLELSVNSWGFALTESFIAVDAGYGTAIHDHGGRRRRKLLWRGNLEEGKTKMSPR